MDNITIGQYVPGDSWIYKMDPRMKIFLTIFWIVVLFLLPNIYFMLGFLGLTILVVLLARIPFIKMIKGMKPIIFLMIFTFIIQVLFYKTDTTHLLYTFHFKIGLYPLLVIIMLVLMWIIFMKFMPSKTLWTLFIAFMCFLVQDVDLFQHINFVSFLDKKAFGYYEIPIYEASLINGAFIVLRVIITIAITSILTFTTSSMDINNGFSALLKPLKVIKVPVGTISMMLSLTLRFVPTLVLETNKIMKAQASRGVDFEEAKMGQKIKQIISLLVPMFVVSIKKAEDLANSMEARGYVIDQPRTQIDKLQLHLMDYLAFVFSIIMLVGVIIGRIYL